MPSPSDQPDIKSERSAGGNLDQNAGAVLASGVRRGYKGCALPEEDAQGHRAQLDPCLRTSHIEFRAEVSSSCLGCADGNASHAKATRPDLVARIIAPMLILVQKPHLVEANV